jgi:hypothetical protein
VIEAARADHGPAVVGRLYTELGRRSHGPDDAEHADRHAVVAKALAACELPGAAAGDPSWDEAIRANMNEIEKLVGDGVGVPIVALADSPQGWLAMSGPILARVSPLEHSLNLWDAVSTVIGHDGLCELKRHRAGGGPDRPQLDPQGMAVG